MRKKGKIATWNDDKGYGFIKPLDGGSQIFIHIKAFANRSRRPEVGEVVAYVVTKDSQGRLRAKSATLAGQRLREAPRSKTGVPGIMIALMFFAAVGSSALFTNLSSLIPVAYAVISFITYVVYAIDKSAAQSGRWRTSEGTLHFLALMGGWPGALVAQETLRHKSKKASFRIVFWATVLVNCAGLAWLHTADGQNTLDRLLASEQISTFVEFVD